MTDTSKQTIKTIFDNYWQHRYYEEDSLAFDNAKAQLAHLFTAMMEDIT